MAPVMKKSYPWGASLEEFPIKSAEIEYDTRTREHVLCLHVEDGCVYMIPMEAVQKILQPTAQSIAKSLDKLQKLE